MGWHRSPRLSAALILGAFCFRAGAISAQSPIPGHYPPGQSGLRGAATPGPGVVITNFNRFFSNLDRVDGDGEPVAEVQETRYANVTMISWTTNLRILGMAYGALVGIPFSTGNLRPADNDVGSTALGLGDVLLTPLSLYGKSSAFDYQVQFTLWSASGHFEPGGSENRGTGFWSLVYSLGGVFYPGGDRKAWSLSAVARFGQNFEQEGSGITPGDDLVIDAGLGRSFTLGGIPIEAGASGFAVWQLNAQTEANGISSPERYRYFGLGPEASASLTDRLGLVVRAQWEFGTRNAVEGNNLWLILKYRL